MAEEIKKTNNKYLIIGGIIVIVAVFGMGMTFMGQNSYVLRNENNQNVITVTGHGEVQAVPDIANISFSIRKEAKTVKEAQAQVAEIEKKVLESLKANNILEKDIKTVSASFNPKYEYKYGIACNQYNCPGRNVVVGYEAYENINLKIRSTDDTGKIMQELGAIGVTDLYGPNFTVDNEDDLKVVARKKAIDDAKAKAKVLAKDLGIRLGKMTSYNEGGNYPTPMYAKTMMADSAVGASAPAELPKGENTISSDVTITYEIR
jgi:uncharacterized protein YggE